MGNLCPIFGTQSTAGPTERSSLIGASGQRQQVPSTPQHSVSSPAASRDPYSPQYTTRSVASTRKVRAPSDETELVFDKLGLDNLDKRLNDIASLYNLLLERYFNLKTGLLQLEQIARDVCARAQMNDDVTNDVICDAFKCLARQIEQAAGSESPINANLKQQSKHWIEVTFDSRSLRYDEISFLNMYNLLGRYAWELSTKAPPLRQTVAMTTQEEEMFRRDLLVASLNSAANGFSANFSRLRRVDEQLGLFEKLGFDAGERLSGAARLMKPE